MWGLSLVDISQAFPQSDLLLPSQRVRLIPPDYVSCPWTGDLRSDRSKRHTHAFLTMRPLYGTKCAPLRWYNRLNSVFTEMSWHALTSDPCMYRYTKNNKLCGLCVTHVDDILFTGDACGLAAFQKVVSQFTNSGIIHLTESNPLIYLGLDIHLKENSIQVSQQSYAEEKLRAIELSDLVLNRKFITPESRRRTAAKQVIGSLLWLSQTRLDLCFLIARLSSTMVPSLQCVEMFSKWVVEANKIIRRSKQQNRYINFRSPFDWVPSDGTVAASFLQIFLFVDAGYASLPGQCSIEAMVMVVGKINSRNGDMLACGSVLDFMAKKIYRVCKSSLAAECIGISNGADIGLRTRVLGVEILTGVFLREVVDSKNSYSVTSPFGFAPGLSDVKTEVQSLLRTGEDNPVCPVSAPPLECSAEEILQEKTIRDKLFAFDKEQLGVLKLLMLTDSANAYSSLVSGFPHTVEKSMRVILSYTRNLLTVMCISFIDKDYNLADCGTKSPSVIQGLLTQVLQRNIFKLGFMGRSWIQEQRAAKRRAKKNQPQL